MLALSPPRVAAALLHGGRLLAALARRLGPAVGVVLASRLLLLGLGVMARRMAGLTAAPLGLWSQWDSGWYLHIVEHGYTESEHLEGGLQGQANVVFFPAYPLLLRALTPVLSPIAAGVTVSTVCLLAATHLLYVHVRERAGERAGVMAMLSLNFFPGSFIFSSVMTESLFVLATLAAFHATQRRTYGWAAGWGAVAAATRATGVLLALGMVVDWFRGHLGGAPREVRWSELLKLSLAPLGLVAFMLFLHWRFDDAFAFQSLQFFWHRRLHGPLPVLVHALASGDVVKHFMVLYLAAAVGAVALAWRTLTGGELLFVALALLVPLSSSLESMPRYALGLFPVHVAMGVLMARREWLGTGMLGCLALVNGFLMGLWSQGHPAFY
jgi:hypothetical protein